MGFRFQRRIKIAPGLRLNISKTGISTSVGTKGASVNIGKKGVTRTLGIPGTGLSHRETIAAPPVADDGAAPKRPHILKQIVAGLILAALAVLIGNVIF